MGERETTQNPAAHVLLTPSEARKKERKTPLTRNLIIGELEGTLELRAQEEGLEIKRLAW